MVRSYFITALPSLLAFLLRDGEIVMLVSIRKSMGPSFGTAMAVITEARAPRPMMPWAKVSPTISFFGTVALALAVVSVGVLLNGQSN